jgi:hypothetical protein
MPGLTWCRAAPVRVRQRCLPHLLPTKGGLSLESCAVSCGSAGFSIAGTEIGGCWCGDAIPTRCTNLTGTTKDDCKHPCAGNSSQICGGQCAVSAYEFSCEAAPPTPPPAPITAPEERGVAIVASSASCEVSVWQLAL